MNRQPQAEGSVNLDRKIEIGDRPVPRLTEQARFDRKFEIFTEHI
ncbi:MULTISPECIES: hypothetical protein [unclassified Microcoleus]|nr:MULTISPECIES: hypothetical protein [unclassified Microcoleus]